MVAKSNDNLLTFEGHLQVLKKLLLRICGVTACLAIFIFCMKDKTFEMLLAPSKYDFVTYNTIEDIINLLGFDFHFDKFKVDLIATDLSSQFMTHISTAIYLGLLGTSPYILYELFGFVSPALYENEKKYSLKIMLIVYALFILGVLMSYYVLFPISFRFLGTYSVSEMIHSTITLDSYISTFVTLTLLMGLVFQLPVITFILGKMGIISSKMLSQYRRHALITIMVVAAVITPPDLMTLLLVTIPLYLLFEISIQILRITGK